jgi:hypothetical protein
MHGRLSVAAALVAGIMALGACGQGGGATNSAPAANPASPAPAAANGAAAAPSNATDAAAATPSEPPEHFIARLMALYATNSPFWKAQPGSAAAAKYDADFYDPSWTRLVADNSVLAGKGGSADLDYDPVCQCQDSGATYVYVSGATAAGGLFNAKVKTTSNDTPPWTIVLKAEPGGWRVYDVIGQEGSLRAWLTRHNDCWRSINPNDDAALVKCFGDRS